jgi:CubicO group peptidase (beta-lactamase class C family)
MIASCRCRVIVASLVLMFTPYCVVPAAEPEPGAAPIPVTGAADPRLAAFDELMKSFLQEHKLPGAALAVTRQGKLVYSRGFGYADLENKTPVEPDSLFRIASISKPITAVATLQLVEQGKLHLDDRVVELLDVKPHIEEGKVPDPRLQRITVRQLLQHTSGWDRDKSFDPMFRPITIARVLKVPAPAGPDAVISYMFGRELDFNPGERYAYSNLGYCILGRIIEKLTGQKYDDYVKEHVLHPVGATATRLGRTLPEFRAAGEVKYYEPDNPTGKTVFIGGNGSEGNTPEKVPLPYGTWHLEAMDSHGGWISSAPDLVRFASAFDKPAECRLLKAVTIGTMFNRPEGSAGYEPDGRAKPFYYALGWNVRPDQPGTGLTAQWHTGSLDGTSTILVRRSDGLCWAVLFNSRNGAPSAQAPSRKIDPLVHEAVRKVSEWPE